VCRYVSGELPGDYGFDPLGLSSTPESLDRNQELELLHARWAMLGIAGGVGTTGCQMCQIGYMDILAVINSYMFYCKITW
jgi:hypothetical protein